MAPRLPTRAIAQPFLTRSYATQIPPAPFTTPVENTTGNPTSASNSGTTSPSSPSSTPHPSNDPTPTPTPAVRVYPARKQFLNDYYNHLIKTSPMFLLFETDNLSVRDWGKIRSAIRNVTIPTDLVVPSPPSSSSSTSDPSTSIATSKKKKKTKTPKVEDVPVDATATFTVLRTGVFAAMASKTPSTRPLKPWLEGQRALLHSQYLSPPYLQQVLAATNKAIKSCQRDPKLKQPKLNLIVGLMEDRLLGAKEVQEVAKLPDMQSMRGQLVGSLEMPGRSLLGLLGQAGGGGLVRTLQGLEESLKEKEGGAETSA